MPDSVEKMRMINLLKQLRGDILSIEEARNARLIRDAGADLQQVYKFHLMYRKSFVDAEHYLRSLYRSYNFAVRVINEALSTKTPISEVDKFDECLEVMIDLCDKIIISLRRKK